MFFILADSTDVIIKPRTILASVWYVLDMTSSTSMRDERSGTRPYSYIEYRWTCLPERVFPLFPARKWCSLYIQFLMYSRTSRLDFRRSLVSGLRAFGGGARAPFPNSGWWSSLSNFLFRPVLVRDHLSSATSHGEQSACQVVTFTILENRP